jgi:hypothetical protein
MGMKQFHYIEPKRKADRAVLDRGVHRHLLRPPGPIITNMTHPANVRWRNPHDIRRLCVPKTRFGNVGNEGHREHVVM